MAIYLTTPLYYVNDIPHIGHAYTTTIADILIRYHKLFGEKTYFLTGTDEHGQKCQQAAEARGLAPQIHADEMVQNYQRIWKELEISYDIFMRTTADFHKKSVQACLNKLYQSQDIYAAEYTGWYCVTEEIFYTEKAIQNGQCPQGHPVTQVHEKNYFFKMSHYQTQLIEYIQNHPNYILPQYRKNEVLGFLNQPLADLCISRPKSRLTWGIELPFDSDYVTYVWFDALLNYATAVGLEQPEKQELFKKWWVDTSAIHLIGKDILTTHAVYWSTMLFALKLPLPLHIFAHGWWLTESNEKMSKSKGRVVNPLAMKNLVGIDGFRYFLAREIQLGNDAQFSAELMISRVNSELANNLGNLLSRTIQLVHKYFEGKIPETSTLREESPAGASLKNLVERLADKVKIEILDFNLSSAIGCVIEVLTAANKFLEEQAPWKTAESDRENAARVLRYCLETLRVAALLLQPVMPLKMNELLQRLGVSGEPLDFLSCHKFFQLKGGQQVHLGSPLFPRISKLN